MEAQNSHLRTFSPRYYEMDRYGTVTPLTMLSLFEETAFTHCDDTGWSVYRLRDSGFGWVLLHGSYRMDRYPSYKEKFTIETRLAAARLFFGLREFIVRGEDGRKIGGARSLWTFYDVERKRPTRILDPILKAWGHDPSVPCERMPPPDDPPSLSCIDPVRAYDVRFSDIDTNGHVNNVNYLEWALEALPSDVLDEYSLSSMDGWYLHQVTYGQRVLPAVEARPPADNSSADAGARRFDLAVYEGSRAGAADGPAAGAPSVCVDSPRLVCCARSSWSRRKR